MFMPRRCPFRWAHGPKTRNWCVYLQQPSRIVLTPKQKQIGLLNWTALWEGLKGLSLRIFITILGWSEERLEMLLMEVREDMKNPNIHPMHDLYATSLLIVDLDGANW